MIELRFGCSYPGLHPFLNFLDLFHLSADFFSHKIAPEFGLGEKMR